MSTELKLYELAQQYRDIEALFDEGIPDDVIRDSLESLTGEISDKVLNIGKLVRNREASAEAIRVAAEQMMDRARLIDNSVDRIKAYALLNMNLAGIKEIKCPYFTMRIQANPESVKIADGAVIPASFMVTPEPPPPRPDKKLLKEALKGGAEIEGVWLEKGEHLRIKV